MSRHVRFRHLPGRLTTLLIDGLVDEECRA
jgi:hypothetical protein